jgi:hypothetical protein
VVLNKVQPRDLTTTIGYGYAYGDGDGDGDGSRADGGA